MLLVSVMMICPKSNGLQPTDSSILANYSVNYEHLLTLLLYYPCLCCHLFLWVCGLFEWKQICACFV